MAISGSIKHRGNRWQALWDLPPGLDGNRRQKAATFKTQREAKEHLASVATQLNQGTYAEPSRQPLAHYLEREWLPAVAGTVRPATHQRYASVVAKQIATHDIGATPLRSITGGMINALSHELEREGLSVGSRRLVHGVLSHALADAVRWDKLTRSPAAAADPPKASSTKVRSWSERELRQFLDHVRGDRMFACWRLMATSGCRRGEALGIQWQTVDLERGRLRIEQQLVQVDGVCKFGPTKSSRGNRTIALDPVTTEILLHHREVQQLERDLAGDAYEDNDLMFADELGRMIPPWWLTDAFARLRKAAGLPTGSLHILRHTVATIGLRTIPLHVIAARLGDDPRQILSTYAHLLPQSDSEAAAAIAAAVDEFTPELVKVRR
jgi:integrase